MKFSVTIQPKLDDWKIIKEAEDLGYDAAWVPDSQMIWSDCYATMALAAQATSKIEIGTGVAIPGTRIAPVTAHSIASINLIAPGRTFLGIGTGHTAMRVMGMNPMPIKPFREYLRVVRSLLNGEEVEYSLNGKTRPIRFLHGDLGFRNIEDSIPIYVAANGPRALQTAGAYGDGLITVFADEPEVMTFTMGMVNQGAQEVGRDLGTNYHTAALALPVIQRAGEAIDSERIVRQCGSFVTAVLHFVYEIYNYTKQEEVVPEYMRSIWDEYRNFVDSMNTKEDRRFQELHDGHCTYHVEAERKFITPDMIRGVCIVGSPSEIVEELRKAESLGLKEVSLLPSMIGFRESMEEFATEVMSSD